MRKKYALDLDDVHAGWVAAPDGFFDLVPWLRERRGALLIEPAGAFWAWLDEGLEGERREAAIVAFDDEGQEVERLVVEDVWISEIGLPRLDAAGAGAGSMWIQLEARTAEVRAAGETTRSARAAGVAIDGCQLFLGGAEAPPLPVEAIRAVSFALDRRTSLHRLTMTVAGGPDPAAAEALVGGDAALEYVDSQGKTVARVELRVAGLDVQMAAADAESAPRATLALAGRGLRLGARRESGRAGDDAGAEGE